MSTKYYHIPFHKAHSIWRRKPPARPTHNPELKIKNYSKTKFSNFDFDRIDPLNVWGKWFNENLLKKKTRPHLPRNKPNPGTRKFISQRYHLSQRPDIGHIRDALQQNCQRDIGDISNIFFLKKNGKKTFVLRKKMFEMSPMSR